MPFQKFVPREGKRGQINSGKLSTYQPWVKRIARDDSPARPHALFFVFFFRVRRAQFAACNFTSLEQKMRDLLDKRGKKREEKKKGKITDHVIRNKRREICALCRSVSWRS